MDIIINETGEKVELNYMVRGQNIILDFVGSHGGLHDKDSFLWDEELGVWRCDQVAYAWWSGIVNEYQELDARIRSLYNDYDKDEVDHEVSYACTFFLEETLISVHQALDERFGKRPEKETTCSPEL